MVLARQPGIYVQASPTPTDAPIKLRSGGVVGFVGIAERGPLQSAVRLKSFEEYQRNFGGFGSSGFLPYAIYGFFNSGGTECVVVRTAGQTGAGAVSSAEFQVSSMSHKPFARFIAVTEGSWGNRITLKLWHSVAARIELCKVDEKGKSFESIEETKLKLGSVVRVQAEGRVYFRRVLRTTASRVYLDREINNLARFAESGTKLEVLNFSCAFSDGRLNENHLMLSSTPTDENYFVKVLNERSALVRVIEMGKSGSFPEEISFRPFSKGRDGILEIKPADFIGDYQGNLTGRGLGILEGVEDVTVVAIPDAQIFFQLDFLKPEQAAEACFAVQTALITHCEKLPRRFAVLDAPNFSQAMKVSVWNRRFDSMNAANYYPHLEMIDPSDRQGVETVTVPPSGHIAGSIQKLDREEGAIRSPANVYLPGVVGLSQTLEEGERDFLYEDRVNVMKLIPGRGVKVWGARTLSSDPEWKFISIRRTFSLISEALQAGTGWAVFEPNNPALRKRLVRSVSGFLVNLWRDGFLAGKTAEEAFFVRCDEELNPPEDIDAGILTVVVGIALAKPTEFIVIQLSAERESSHVVIDEKLL